MLPEWKSTGPFDGHDSHHRMKESGRERMNYTRAQPASLRRERPFVYLDNSSVDEGGRARTSFVPLYLSSVQARLTHVPPFASHIHVFHPLTESIATDGLSDTVDSWFGSCAVTIHLGWPGCVGRGRDGWMLCMETHCTDKEREYYLPTHTRIPPNRERLPTLIMYHDLRPYIDDKSRARRKVLRRSSRSGQYFFVP